MSEEIKIVSAANEIVTMYAEDHLQKATEKIEELMKKRKGIDPIEAQTALKEFNTWFSFVRDKKEQPPNYVIKVRNGKAKITLSKKSD